MSKKKKEIEKWVSRIQRDYERILEQKRLEWFQQVCREAKDTYSFASLGELIVHV